MIVEKSEHTPILEFIDESRARTLNEILELSGLPIFQVRVALKHLRTLGAIVCTRGVAARLGGVGPCYWRYLKAQDIEVVESHEVPEAAPVSNSPFEWRNYQSDYRPAWGELKTKKAS